MTQVIVYTNTTGNVAVVNMAAGIDPNTMMSSVIPSGVAGFVIDASTLPTAAQNTWSLDSKGNVTSITMTPTAALVNAERDRRLYGGFVYNNVVYQTDETSIDNVLGAAQLAFMAIVAGSQTGDYLWSGSTMPFVWIASNNTFVQIDAQTVVLFAKAAAAFRQTITISSRLLKNAIAAGQTPDIYADTAWGADAGSPTSTSGAAQTATSTASSSSSATPTASSGS